MHVDSLESLDKHSHYFLSIYRFKQEAETCRAKMGSTGEDFVIKPMKGEHGVRTAHLSFVP